MGRDRQEAHLTADRALGALFVAFFASVVAGPALLENDLFWHLAVGRSIAEAGFPYVDPLGWTTEGMAWSPPEWLSELVLYGLHALGGLLALAFVRLGLLALLGGLLFSRARTLGAPAPIAALALGIAAAPASVHLPMRPLLVGHVLTALVLRELTRMRAGEKHRVALLPLVFVVWANLHPSWPLALALVGLAAASWLGLPRLAVLDRLRMRPAPLDPKDARTLAIATALSLAAPLVRPDLLDGALYPFVHVVGLGDQASEILEWFPLSPTDPLHVATVLGLGISITLLARRRGDPFELFAVLLVTALVLRYQRFLPLATIVAGPTLASLVRVTPPVLGRVAIGVAAATALALAVVALPSPTALDRSWAAYPHDAVRAVGERPADERTFATFETGGLVAWTLPGRRVYLDSRFDLYARAGVFREYLRLRRGEDVLATFDARGVGSALVPTSAVDENFVRMREALLAAGWRVTHDDTRATLFVRPDR